MIIMSSGDRSETRPHLGSPSPYLISEILVRKPHQEKNEIILDKVRFPNLMDGQCLSLSSLHTNGAFPSESLK